MSRREITFFLDDILEGIGAIEDYIYGLSEEEFASDRKTFDAVIRNLEVIGEACINIPDRLRDQYAQDTLAKNYRPQECCHSSLLRCRPRYRLVHHYQATP
jgi:uncharacterized protein with HEPN domain